MAMIQQNISGVKLERLRKKSLRRTRIAKGVSWGVFGVSVLVTLSWEIRGLILVLGLPSGPSVYSLLGFAAETFGGVLISFLVFLLVYLCMSWALGGPWEEFAQNYKNKYVLLELQKIPGFSQLKYLPDKSLSAGELCRSCLPPSRNPPRIRSMDYWEGCYDCVRFQAAQLQFRAYQSNSRLFDGQVMRFSRFDAHKISETPVQVFARRPGREKPKGLTFSEKLQTEHEIFNRQFSVYAQDGQNAFYILTPQVLEDILEFSRLVDSEVYLVFSGSSLYVGCEQAANPFDPQEEQPVELQIGRIRLSAAMVQKARDILIHLEQDRSPRDV